MATPAEKLARSSMGYTIFGLLGGVYYRELTRPLGYTADKPTQLRAFHGHCFTLGTFFFLIVLLLEKAFNLSKQKNYKKFYITYNAGIGTSLLMMLVHGTLTILGKDKSHPRVLAWTSGLGHSLTAVGFAYFYQVLRAAVRESEAKPEK